MIELWVVFQSNVSHEEVLVMLATGANEGSFVELQKGVARPGSALECGELVPWNQVD